MGWGGHSAAVLLCLRGCLFLEKVDRSRCTRAATLRVCEILLRILLQTTVRRVWLLAVLRCVWRETETRREGRGVCSGQRPPAAINQGDSRSTAREALRLMLASPGGGSSSRLKIHPSPLPLATCLLHSLGDREMDRKEGGGGRRVGCGGRKVGRGWRGGGEGERNLSALLGHITQFHCQWPIYEEQSNVSARLKCGLFHY